MYSMVTIINNTVLHILMLISKSESLSVMSDSLQPYGLLGPWDSPGKNIGVGCQFFLQKIFPAQGLNPLLLHNESESLSVMSDSLQSYRL